MLVIYVDDLVWLIVVFVESEVIYVFYEVDDVMFGGWSY